MSLHWPQQFKQLSVHGANLPASQVQKIHASDKEFTKRLANFADKISYFQLQFLWYSSRLSYQTQELLKDYHFTLCKEADLSKVENVYWNLKY